MSDMFLYHEEIDLQKFVDEQARKLQRNVDEATLDKAADTLAGFGYVKVVRCRDCKYMFDWAYDRMLCKMWADGGMDDDAKNVLYPTVKPDGFCAWGRRADG